MATGSVDAGRFERPFQFHRIRDHFLSQRAARESGAFDVLAQTLDALAASATMQKLAESGQQVLHRMSQRGPNNAARRR